MSVAQDRPEPSKRSPWAIRVLSVAGIPIRIHFTFLLFLAWIAITSKGLGWMFFVVAVFACVLLHELGHALTAKRFGIATRDITLYPIGGVAVLDGRPTARAELWIALAGPAVNVVIAAALAAGLLATGGIPEPSMSLDGRGFWVGLLTANVTLVLFNMIPAFPMDGGRVLRAALSLRIGEVRATQIAAFIGQGLAILFGFFALFQGQILWMVVAFFVFLGAGQEASQTVTRSFLAGHKLADAMQNRFRTIPHGASLDEAAKMLLAGSQHDFPVLAGEEIAGILTRTGIAQGLAADGNTGYVAAHMRRDYKTAHPNLPLERAMDMFTSDDATPILVMDEGRLLGMVTQENLSEFIMLEHARRQTHA